MAFSTWSGSQLQNYLKERNICSSNTKKSLLLSRVKAAHQLNVPVATKTGQEDTECNEYKQKKLVLDGGCTVMPDPSSLQEWDRSPTNFPDVQSSHIDDFFMKKNKEQGVSTHGDKAKAKGKSLYLSGNVGDVAFHSVHSNVSRCFIKGRVQPQMKENQAPYVVWVMVVKSNGKIEEAECSCKGGIYGSCKHVAALLEYVQVEVARGANRTCTEKVMRWHKPKKGKKADYLCNIPTFKVSAKTDVVSILQAQGESSSRHAFDPRPLQLRQEKSLQSDFDIDSLATITGGKCGLLLYRPQTHEASNIMEICNEVVDVSTSQEMYSIVSAAKEIDPKLPSRQFHSELMGLINVSDHARNVLQESTKKQGDSHIWQSQRQGRLTASMMCSVAKHVDLDCDSIIGRSDSLVARVMGYYGVPSTAAIRWGNKREGVVRAIFKKVEGKKHKKFAVGDCGLVLSRVTPVVGASPDGLVTCKCHGPRALEVKNPWTDRSLSINDYAMKEGSCLEERDGGIFLRRDHPYWVQVQTQMHCLEVQEAYFVLKTLHKSNGLHIEVLQYEDPFMQLTVKKASVFFREAIVPELQSGDISRKVRERAVAATMDAMLEKLDQQFRFAENQSTVSGQSSVSEPSPDQSPVAEPTPDQSPVSEPSPDQSPVAEPTPDQSPVAEPTPDQSPVSEPSPDQSPVAEPTPDQSPVSEPSPDQSPVSEPSPDNVLYPCGECMLECIDDPKNDADRSVACDKCDKWFHFRCVGLSGKERFLKRKRCRWFCMQCDVPKRKKSKLL